jgi:hypothetical protein
MSQVGVERPDAPVLRVSLRIESDGNAFGGT